MERVLLGDNQSRIVQVECLRLDILDSLSTVVRMHPFEIPKRRVVASLERAEQSRRFTLVVFECGGVRQIVLNGHGTLPRLGALVVQSKYDVAGLAHGILDRKPHTPDCSAGEAIEFRITDRRSPRQLAPPAVSRAVKRVAGDALSLGDVLLESREADRNCSAEIELHAVRSAIDGDRFPFRTTGDVVLEHCRESRAECGKPRNVGGVKQAIARRRNVEEQLAVLAHRREVKIDEVIDRPNAIILRRMIEPPRSYRDVDLGWSPNRAGAITVL